MSGPFIYVGSYAIKDGKEQDARKAFREVADLVETNEPRVIAFNYWFDALGRTVTAVQVHPDPASMDFHLGMVAQHLDSAWDWIESTVREQVYGEPSAMLTNVMAQFAAPGTTVSLFPEHGGGFIRASVR
jgi:hypothetical protein